jgi:enoyl-CoA hydratase
VVTGSASTAPLLDIVAGRATLTLNRPAHLNRLSGEDLLTLQAQLARVAGDASVRVLVLTGAGRAFCAGYHLGEFAAAQRAPNEGPDRFEQTVNALTALAVPTLCRLNGSVYGGATDLALACDFRIGVASMTLRMPAARLGLHYYASGLQRFVSTLGLQATKRLFLLAQEVEADELLRIGYLDACVAPQALDDTVETFAAALEAGAPMAIQGMKRSLADIAGGHADVGTLREREATCAASEDLREGLAAWSQKRAPRFVGR